MRISSIPAYRFSKISSNVRPKIKEQIPPQPETVQPNFKGCNVFKVVGFIAGAGLCAIAAPGLAMIGGAGLLALPGMGLGDYIDRKIDKANGEESDY